MQNIPNRLVQASAALLSALTERLGGGNSLPDVCVHGEWDASQTDCTCDDGWETNPNQDVLGGSAFVWCNATHLFPSGSTSHATEHSVPTKTIAIIVAVVAVAVGAVGLLVYCCCKRRKRHAAEDETKAAVPALAPQAPTATARTREPFAPEVARPTAEELSYLQYVQQLASARAAAGITAAPPSALTAAPTAAPASTAVPRSAVQPPHTATLEAASTTPTSSAVFSPPSAPLAIGAANSNTAVSPSTSGLSASALPRAQSQLVGPERPSPASYPMLSIATAASTPLWQHPQGHTSTPATAPHAASPAAPVADVTEANVTAETAEDGVVYYDEATGEYFTYVYEDEEVVENEAAGATTSNAPYGA